MPRLYLWELSISWLKLIRSTSVIYSRSHLWRDTIPNQKLKSLAPHILMQIDGDLISDSLIIGILLLNRLTISRYIYIHMYLDLDLELLVQSTYKNLNILSNLVKEMGKFNKI